jgi:hypothetical protein
LMISNSENENRQWVMNDFINELKISKQAITKSLNILIIF